MGRWILIVMMAITGVSDAATLQYNTLLRNYFWSGDGVYLYGGKMTLAGASSTTKVVRRTAAGVETDGMDFTSLVSTYRLSTIFATSTDGTVLAVVSNSATSRYYVFKSVDYGANFGANSPAFNDGNYVLALGGNISAVGVLSNMNICEATIGGVKTLLIGEYNINASRTPGSTNDLVRILKSTDTGSSWNVVINYNGDGLNSNIRHVHLIQQNPYNGDIYWSTGDTDAESAIWRWNGTTDISGLSNHSPAWYASNCTYGANGLSVGVVYGSQTARAGGFAFDASHIFWSVDTTALTGYRGFWDAPADLSAFERTDNIIENYTSYNTFNILKTSSGVYVSSIFISAGASDFNAPLFVSPDGINWRVCGDITLKNAVSSTFLPIYDWKGRVYIPSPHFAIGHWGNGGTLVLDQSSASTGDESTLLTPTALSFWLDAEYGSDQYSGISPWEPWKTSSAVYANYNSFTSGTQIHFRGGQEFGAVQNDSTTVVPVSNLIFDSWGAGQALLGGAKRVLTWTHPSGWDSHIYLNRRAAGDTLYAMYKGAGKDSLLTLVTTQALLLSGGHGRYRTSQDSTLVYMTNPDDITWLWSTKSPAVSVGGKSNITFRNLIIGYAADKPSTGSRLAVVSGASTNIVFDGCRFRGGPYLDMMTTAGATSNNSVRNCIFEPSVTSWAVYMRGVGNTIYGNTFDCQYGPRFVTDSGTVVKNNIFTGSSPITLSSVTYVGDYNIFPASYGLAAWRVSSGQEAHGAAVDPKFINAAGRDYRLKPDSPAISGGTPLSGVTADFTGAAIPNKNGYWPNGAIAYNTTSKGYNGQGGPHGSSGFHRKYNPQ